MVELALPIVYVNLGGEMLYILDQRLHAQKIPSEKAYKVMHDVTSMMFSKQFLTEMLTPQPMYSKAAMRMLFDKLAHASIMRLNSASMDKLYDLMTMAVKYQALQCPRPSDLLLVTLNHLDSVGSYVMGGSEAADLIHKATSTLLQNYARLSMGEWQAIRNATLNFFQDIHIRVSLFLKDKVQNQTGRFLFAKDGELPFGFQVPGKIRIFLSDGRCKENVFNTGGHFTVARKEGFMGIRGDRVTKLGLNMYKETKPIETQPVVSAKNIIKSSEYFMNSSELESKVRNPNALAQLDLLSRLIKRGGGGSSTSSKQSSSGNQFKLNLFQSEEEEYTATIQKEVVVVGDRGANIVVIDAKKKNMNDELMRIMQEMSLDDDYDDDYRHGRSRGSRRRQEDDDDELDVLALMDQEG